VAAYLAAAGSAALFLASMDRNMLYPTYFTEKNGKRVLTLVENGQRP
jgi:hypothetical protein